MGTGPNATCIVTDLELADDLTSLLTLERVDRDLFRGRNANFGPRRTLYGGQVAAQCVIAAAATVEEGRLPHSLHGYFLRAGRSDLPVILEVDRDRDGRSFSARHVVAVQDGEVIFSMITSFQTESDGRRGLRRRAPPRGARARGTRRGGWNPLLEVREVTPTDFLKGVFTDCVWVRSLDARSATTRWCTGPPSPISPTSAPGSASERGAHRPRRPVHRPLRVVPRGHPGRRLGARRPAAGQGARGARGCYEDRCATREGALGATLYQEHLLLPGSMADLVDEAMRMPRPERGPAGGRAPRPLEEIRRGQERAPGGAAEPKRSTTSQKGAVMPIAITEDHRALGQTASDFLAKHDARGAARGLLEAEHETLPPFWDDLAELGWLGLHLPEDVRRLGLRAARARRRRRGAGPRRGARAVRADGHGQRGHRRGGARRRDGAAGCRDWPTGRSCGGVALAVGHHGVGGHGRRNGAGGPGRRPRPRPRAAGGRRRHRGRRGGERRQGRRAGATSTPRGARPGSRSTARRSR